MLLCVTMNRRFLDMLALAALILAGAISAVGCSDSGSNPVTSGIPAGVWFNEESFTLGGTQLQRKSYLTVSSQSEGVLTDTIFALRNGEWKVDSVVATDLRFNPVGDGYQRTLEIYNAATVAPDTVLRYWFLFRRGDSLFHYVGMRFVGQNPGLVGEWHNDENDILLLNGCSRLTFGMDSVAITDRCEAADSVRTSYLYQTNKDTLTITGRQLYGTRFEVVPGWSLYLTTRATGGYRIVR